MNKSFPFIEFRDFFLHLYKNKIDDNLSIIFIHYF